MNKLRTELKTVIDNITQVNKDVREEAQRRLDLLTKPQGSLGRLEELAKQVAGITGTVTPVLKNKVIFTLAADHGVAQEGVSAFPQEVTAQMVDNFLRGGAGINVLARHAGARVVVADMGIVQELKIKNEKCKREKKFNITDTQLRIKKINLGTKNMAREAAMTKEEAVKSIEAGIELLEEELGGGVDLVGTGDMGIANTTASSAITAAITGKPVEIVTGRGAGLDDEGLANKIRVIKQALRRHAPKPDDAIDVLAKVGGFEIGGLAGIILACAAQKIPVLIDGFISGAAGMLAYILQPKVKDYMIAAHCSVERGHKIVLAYIGLNPILDLNLRLGEGTGAALAMNVVEAAVKILGEMATFGQAGVSQEK